MRIVYLWDADYPWDVRTEKICASLVDAGHEVHIVARNRRRQALAEKLVEGTVHRMPPWPVPAPADDLLSFPAFFNPRWILHLWRTVRETRAEVVIVRDLPLCPTALLVGRVAALPVILDMAENYPAMLQAVHDSGRRRPGDLIVRSPALASLTERFCLPRVAWTLVVVEESAERIARLGAAPDRISVVSNTPPADRTDGARSMVRHSTGGPLALVYLGLLEIPRGVGELLDAVRIVVDRGMNVTLQVIGNGRDEALLRERCKRLSLEGVVEFRGYVPRTEAIGLIERADAGIVPHHADEAWNTTIPNKLFDYMAAGLPVISSDTRPCARILESTGAGLVYRSGDPSSLAEAIETLVDVDLRDRLGRAGQRAIRERYNWETDSATLREVVEELGAKPRTAKLSPPRAPTTSRPTR